MTFRRSTIPFATILCGSFCVTTPALAQSPPAKTAGQLPPGVKRFNFTRENGFEEPTLLALLPQMGWDASVDGPLLIISPEEVKPYHELNSSYRMYTVADGPPIARNLAGKYKSEDTAAFYGCKIVRLKSLAVFAPLTMTLLNDSHLPKPSAFVGMSSSEKLRLLESTFTNAQWRVASGDAGIGVGDLTKEQQAIYLSLLPDPFSLARLSADPADAAKGLGYDSFYSFGVGGDGGDSGSVPSRALAPGAPITLSDSQREAVHLQIAKKFEWYLVYTDGTPLYAGTSEHAPDTAYGYQIASSHADRSTVNGVFGVEMKVAVPNQLKSSQLPSNWDALDVRVDLHASKTVGELVAQVAAATHAKLHCDPRYVDRKFEAIGASARASDVLKALNWALTSTWRRLGDDFVLTDDLVGLGTREMRIDDWLQQNTFLTLQRQAQVAKALHENQYRSLGWSATDPLKPNDATLAKIDAYAAGLNAPEASASSSPLLIPVADLSPAGQTLFHQQTAFIASKAKEQKEQSENLGQQFFGNEFTRPLRYDVVQAGARTQISYLVPGVGKLSAAESAGSATNPDILRESRTQVVSATLPVTSPKKVNALDGTPPARALLVTPRSEAELRNLAKEARARGFDQLWVDVPHGDTSLLSAAVQIGTAQKMAVYASFPLLRSSGNAPTDRNILDETVAQTTQRRNAELSGFLSPGEEIAAPKGHFGIHSSLTTWAQGDRGVSALRNGEYRPLTPELLSSAVMTVGKLATVPGLAGIVLRDTVAPGFNSTFAQSGGVAAYRSQTYDPASQRGYTADLRLACLQKYGFDPIDISPLPEGDRIEVPFDMRVDIGRSDLELPFFRDYGTSASSGTYNGQRGDTIGAKQSWAQWCQFRDEQSASLLRAVREAVAAQHPGLPLLIRRYDNPFDRSTNWYGSAEPPQTLPAAPTPGEKASPVSRRKTDLERARAASMVNYFAVGLPLGRAGYDIGALAGWDGVVVDLGDAPASEVLSVLRTFPPVSSP